MFTYSGTLVNNGVILNGMANASLNFSTPGFVFLTIAIPEPATAWLIGLPALGFARKLRRNRK